MDFLDQDVDAPVYVNKQLEALQNKLKENPNDLISHRRYAEMLLQTPNKQKASLALTSLEEILSKKKNDIDSLVLSIHALRFTGNINSAKNQCEYYIEQYPSTVGFYIQYIQILIIENNFSKAKIFLDAAIEKFGNEEKITRLHIQLSLKNKNWNQALSTCNRALQLDPKNQRLILLRAESLKNLDRLDEAIEKFEEFKERFPHQFDLPMWDRNGNYYSCSSSYAEFCMKQGEKLTTVKYSTTVENKKLIHHHELSDKAKELFIKAVDETVEIISNTQYEKSQNLIRYTQSMCYYHLEKFNESLLVLNEIPSEQLGYTTEHFRCALLFTSKKYAEAIDACETYLKLYPDEKSPQRIIAFSHAGLGNIEQFNELKNKYLVEHGKDSKKDTFDVPLNAGFHIYPKKRFQNDQKFIDFLCSFSGVLCISNPYTKVDIVDYIERAITHYDCKVKNIRMLSGPFERNDGGKQFYDMYKELKKKITFFNQKGVYPCKIKIKIKMNYAEHARYYFDEKSVYNGTGTDQVIDGQKDDFNPERDPDTIDDIKKDFNDNWNDESNHELTDQNWHKLLRAYGKKFDDKPVCESIENELDSEKKQQG